MKGSVGRSARVVAAWSKLLWDRETGDVWDGLGRRGLEA